MSGLFMPRVQEDIDLISLEHKKSDLDFSEWPDEVLVGSVENKIYVIPELGKQPICVKEREGDIYDIGLFRGYLIDGGEYGVYGTVDDACFFENQQIPITALAANDAKIYVGNSSGHIIDIASKEVFANRGKRIHAMCNYNGVIYDAGEYDGIHKSLVEGSVAKRTGPVYSLMKHDAKLFDAGFYKTVYTNTDFSWDVEDSSEFVISIFVKNGRICYYDGDAIFDLWSKLKLADVEEVYGEIKCIKKDYLEELVQ